MSEADSPNDQSGSPAPTEPIALTAALNERWPTIDFPGAMSVDAIPHSSVESVKLCFTGGLGWIGFSGGRHSLQQCRN